MCNAWNHPPDCTCGWGGDGHFGSGNNLGNYGFWWYPDYYKSKYSTYTVPNAKCPVCGAAVYFYKSPTGGRVFFDDLGPPWPKHPCTDLDKQDELLLVLSNVNTKPNWEKEGWLPAFLLRKGYPRNNKLVSFRIFEKRNKRIVLTLLCEELENINHFYSLMFYKKINDDEFEISLYDFSDNKELVLRLLYFGGVWK